MKILTLSVKPGAHRKSVLMAALKDQAKIVPLVGTVEPFLREGAGQRFTGAVLVWGVCAAALFPVFLILLVAATLR